jgi:Trypsin-like peptidase domain
LAAPAAAAMMAREIAVMPTLPALFRHVVCTLSGVLLVLPAAAQDLPTTKITGADLRRALIWTGHYSVMNPGDPNTLFRAGLQSWQASKKYKVTDSLPDEQETELLAEGDKQRDSFGWAKFEDKSIGFSVGVPTKLVGFLGARTNNGGLVYDFEGGVRYAISVRYGDLSCSNVDQQLAYFLRATRPTFRARYGDGYAVGGENDSLRSYLRVVCRTSGVVFASIDINRSNVDKFGLLVSAMADSLSVSRHFNPTAIPRPRLDQPTPTAGDIVAASATSPKAADKPGADVDTDGKTAAIKREAREGPSLTAEQVFDKVSPAVYVVTAGERMGSAVAISEHELLTNCHVVKEVARVTLMRDKAKQPADVVSVNEKADRCVLRTEKKLEKWVAIRSYDDIKVGEPALTVGTPQGLELTVADGLVSSKRSLEGRRLIQTTAPISQGSSGGGLFDAQGHLLGITTFYLKVGQSLNFAIAAEDFAK